jgi:Domain of unknown function (DUF4145)
MAGSSWTCPHCSRPTTVTANDIDTSSLDIHLENPLGPQRFIATVIACPNTECSKLTVQFSQWEIEQKYTNSSWSSKKQLNYWRLVPESAAKVLPAYVPKPIVNDYTEACLIADKSPKASATLARRCLQGMIRDFYGVRKDRLVDEIQAIKDRMDPLTWEAIDAVRSIGNIGAHMEKDINLIVEVDEGEAKELIELIELLIQDWYVTRHHRQTQLESIKKIKATKDAAKTITTAASSKSKT